jgi:hypothetical protein
MIDEDRNQPTITFHGRNANGENAAEPNSQTAAGTGAWAISQLVILSLRMIEP